MNFCVTVLPMASKVKAAADERLQLLALELVVVAPPRCCVPEEDDDRDLPERLLSVADFIASCLTPTQHTRSYTKVQLL